MVNSDLSSFFILRIPSWGKRALIRFIYPWTRLLGPNLSRFILTYKYHWLIVYRSARVGYIGPYDKSDNTPPGLLRAVSKSRRARSEGRCNLYPPSESNLASGYPLDPPPVDCLGDHQKWLQGLDTSNHPPSLSFLSIALASLSPQHRPYPGVSEFTSDSVTALHLRPKSRTSRYRFDDRSHLSSSFRALASGRSCHSSRSYAWTRKILLHVANASIAMSGMSLFLRIRIYLELMMADCF